jgi:hypothetical protein
LGSEKRLSFISILRFCFLVSGFHPPFYVVSPFIFQSDRLCMRAMVAGTNQPTPSPSNKTLVCGFGFTKTDGSLFPDCVSSLGHIARQRRSLRKPAPELRDWRPTIKMLALAAETVYKQNLLGLCFTQINNSACGRRPATRNSVSGSVSESGSVFSE